MVPPALLSVALCSRRITVCHPQDMLVGMILRTIPLCSSLRATSAGPPPPLLSLHFGMLVSGPRIEIRRSEEEHSTRDVISCGIVQNAVYFTATLPLSVRRRVVNLRRNLRVRCGYNSTGWTASVELVSVRRRTGVSEFPPSIHEYPLWSMEEIETFWVARRVRCYTWSLEM